MGGGVLTAAFASGKLAYCYGKGMERSFYYYVLGEKETTEGSKMMPLPSCGFQEELSYTAS